MQRAAAKRVRTAEGGEFGRHQGSSDEGGGDDDDDDDSSSSSSSDDSSDDEEEEEEDDINGSGGGGAQGMRLRERKESAIDQAARRLSETRATAGRLGGAAKAENKKRRFIPRDKQGRFDREDELEAIRQQVTARGTLTRKARQVMKRYKARLSRGVKKETTKGEAFWAAYAVLKNIHDTHRIKPEEHILTDPAAMVAAGLPARGPKDFGRGGTLKPYWTKVLVLFYYHKKVRQGMNSRDAYEEVAKGHSLNERVVRQWNKDFYLCNFRFRRLLTGLNTNKRFSRLDDPDLKRRLLLFLRACLSVERKRKSGGRSKKLYLEDVKRSKELASKEEERVAAEAEKRKFHEEYRAMCARNEREDYKTNDEGAFIHCTCDGEDDGLPMARCENCFGWFHFACLETCRVEGGGEPESLVLQRVRYGDDADWSCEGCIIILKEIKHLDEGDEAGMFLCCV